MLRAAGVACLLVLLVACGGSADPTARGGVIRQTMTLDTCGSRWSAPGGGRVTFAVTNRFREAMEVYLADATSGAVLQELEGIGSGASVESTVVLGNGSYRFQCYPNDASPVLGAEVRVDGADRVTTTTPAVRPVTNNDLIPIAKAYQAWVVGRLPKLARQVTALASDVEAGRPDAARRDWLAAHLTYETLGAAYDAFGDADAAINGAPSTLTDPQHDDDLHGFHKVEALLWGGAGPAAVGRAVTDLQTAVDQLQGQLRTTSIDPNIIALRAHEIVENAIQFELTGATDAGSHTNLATIDANLAGTSRTLALLVPLLRPSYPALERTRAALVAARRLVATYRHGTPAAWTPLSALTPRQREDLDASLEGLVELLAPVAAICDVRMVPEQ